MGKGWTDERRKKQAENIRKSKPWEKSTGARTAKGKMRCKYNALKHGNYSHERKEINNIFRYNRAFVAAVRRWRKATIEITHMRELKVKEIRNELKENNDTSSG